MTDLTVMEERQVIQSLSVTQVKAQVQQIQALMADMMKDGEHYGKSFEGDTKKNLLKPGADKLMFMFRLRPDFEQEIKELPNGHREVITHCKVYQIESGNKIAEGVGSASTLESKHRYRNEKRKCPECGMETIINGKEEYGGGWICFAKKGGCGKKFKIDDPVIAEQKIGKVENPDIADVYNTVLKISKKRAYVDATITATAASDIFTQDLEDILPEEKTTKDLAKEAAMSGREEILNQTAEILKSKDGNGLNVFTETEIANERKIAKEAKDIGELYDQHDRLDAERCLRIGQTEEIAF